MPKKRVNDYEQELFPAPVEIPKEEEIVPVLPPKKEESLVEVKFVMRKQNAALVEFVENGNVTRVSVPANKVSVIGTKAKLSELILNRGIPYGIPWETRLQNITISAEELAQALRNNGLWTSSDVNKNPQSVQGALLSVMRKSLTSIMLVTKDFNKET
jgi:hypothetical protein